MRGKLIKYYELRNLVDCKKKRSVDGLSESNALVGVVEDGEVLAHEHVSKDGDGEAVLSLDAKQAFGRSSVHAASSRDLEHVILRSQDVVSGAEGDSNVREVRQVGAVALD